MSQAQKDFAWKCIDWGEKNYGMGHTLAALGWMESSLGVELKHGKSKRKTPYGITKNTETTIRKRPNFRGSIRRGEDSIDRTGNSISQMRIACLIYKGNVRYIHQWGRNRGVTFTNREAWQLAAQVYRDGTNWQKRISYGKTFRQRVAWLKFLDEKRMKEK